MTFKDRLKNLKRKIRSYLLMAIVKWMTKLPVQSVPRIKRLLLKIFPNIFKKEIDSARRLLPEEFAKDKEAIIQKMADNQISTILEVFFYEKLLAHKKDFISIEGIENVESAYKKNGRFIILSAHFGNWEIIGYTLAKMGYKMNVVARPQAVNQMTEFMNGFRERRGVKVIMKNNILESLKSLNKGECIGMLSDLNAREWGYQVNFFGKKASFYNAPVILSIRGKAPIIPTFTERSPDGKLTIRFEEPISWEKGESMVERIQKYVKRYENAFRRRPDLWCWFHERYKHSELGRIK